MWFGLVAAISCGATAHAAVVGRHASFVVDANSGDVLHADAATKLRYPASLTKMMTLYLVFEQIEDRRLKYSSKIRVSARAASRPPSRLGLKAGETISILQAVRALVTKSANDVATAVAEHISGTEARFAELMTQRARQLGMRHTVFRNASGLPDRKQVTTARDMAQLALRLRDHFPLHFRQFSTRSFRYKGRTYRNHNALLGRMPGVNGIKTGYTRASGFNLVSTVERNGRHVVAVVMGGRTGRARNTKMRKLLTKHVPGASARRSRPRNQRVALRRPPRPATRPQRQARPAAKRLAQRAAPQRRSAPLPSNKPKPARPTYRTAASASLPVPKIEIARVRRIDVRSRRGESRSTGAVRRGTPPSTLQAQAERLRTAEQASLNARFRSAQPPSSLGSRPASGGFHIQVGAFFSADEAHRQLRSIAAKAGSILQGARAIAIQARSGNRQIFRARYAGFDSKIATATCLEMRRRDIDCFVARAN
ncbi:MAG: serine hydrolase [Hyphomicrobiaceae bacterium]